MIDGETAENVRRVSSPENNGEKSWLLEIYPFWVFEEIRVMWGEKKSYGDNTPFVNDRMIHLVRWTHSLSYISKDFNLVTE